MVALAMENGAGIATAQPVSSAMRLATPKSNGGGPVAPKSDGGGSPATTVESIESKLAEARANLAAVEASGDLAITSLPMGVTLQDSFSKRTLLHRLVQLLGQQSDSAKELERTQRRRSELAREAQAWTRFADSPPYSIQLIDRLREEIQVEQLRSTSSEAATSTIDQLTAESRLELTETEEKIRGLNEQLEEQKEPATVARLTWLRDLARLRSQVAAATLGVLDAERRLRQEGLAESRTRLGLLQRQLLIADAQSEFTQADLDKITARIEGDRRQLEQELSDARARESNALQNLDAAREAQRNIQKGANTDSTAATRTAELVTTREAQLETAQTTIRTLRLMLESENVERTMWEMRFAAYKSRSVNTLSAAERRLEDFTRRSDLWKDYQQQQLAMIPSQIELQETRVRSLPADSDLLPVARERLEALRERDQLFLRLLHRIEQVQRLSQRWAEGLRVAEARLPFFGRMQNLFSDAGSFLQRLWAFELFTAEDTITVEGQTITGKRSVTLGKIVMAILILGVGIWVTGLISRILDPIIIRRLNIEANQARLIRRWLRTFMIVCLIMFSLVSVKIPLTIFAFAGGALAIGLGFGMQNLLKNFVSGLILLFERPFRVGDVLDVGGQRGKVTEIGLRASVLELWDGTETLIPNSSLLENNVSNWTYSSRKVRFSITLGVAYGSDTRRVIQLLGEIAERHGVVEKEPKPQVFLTDFGESALSFELRYWVDVIKGNAAQVGSDLRQMIAGTFAENGIVIAFPQRDLHLDSARPLAVEIVSARDGREPANNGPRSQDLATPGV
jgi:small-conductance mechanosensitive channel